MLKFPMLIVTAIATTSAAYAAPVDFTKPVRSLNGTPAMECKEPSEDLTKCKRVAPITLGDIAAGGLSIPDKTTPLTEQVKRGKLAQVVIDGKSVELTSEQVSLIKEQAAKLGLSPIYLLQLVEAIDPASVK